MPLQRACCAILALRPHGGVLLQNRQQTWQQLQASKQTAVCDEADSLTDTDVPPQQLADKDSLFLDCHGLQVHYKQAYPSEVSQLHLSLQSSPPAYSS